MSTRADSEIELIIFYFRQQLLSTTLSSTRERRKIGTITYTEEPLEDDLEEKPGNYSKQVNVYYVLQVCTKRVIIVFPSAKKKTDPAPVAST